MPRYELMYILASSVSDDQVPQITSQIVKFVSDYGGTDVVETQLGKKKLAYPIKKTRNGFYGLINFAMDGTKINEFDAKIHTQDTTIIRYIIVNLDEHLARLEKDKVAQAKLSKPQPTPEELAANPVEAAAVPELVVAEEIIKPEPVSIAPIDDEEEAEAKPKRGRKPKPEMDEAELDKKIEEALNENLLD